MPSPEYIRLMKRAERIREYGENLACSLGNFHGINDYLSQERRRDLDNLIVVQNLLWQLLHLLIVRSIALMAETKQPTDATLRGIADALKDKALRDEVIEEARRWSHHPDWAPDRKAEWAASKMVKFRRNFGTIDLKPVKTFRDAVVAHSTTRKPSPVVIAKVWRATNQVLRTADFAVAMVLGRDPDLSGIAKSHRGFARSFFRTNIHP